MGQETLIRIRAVEVCDGFTVRLLFSDGTSREVDLEPYLHGAVFEPLRNDPMLFGAVRVDSRVGTIVWENSADIDPDVLYYQRIPAWMEMASERPKQ